MVIRRSEVFARIRFIVSRAGVIVRYLPLVAIVSVVACEKAVPSVATRPSAVYVAPVVSTDGARDLRLNGTLSAELTVSLGFSTVGTVERVLVDEGQTVRRGDTLAVLVQRTYRDALGIAQAQANRAEDAYQRFLPMRRNGTLPEVQMIEVETAREATRRSVSIAQKNFDDTVLRASVSGIVARRNLEPGSVVAPGLPAFDLVQTRTMLATAPVAEVKIAAVERGMQALVTVPALRDTFSGTIREIAVTANPLTRTYDVKVAIPNPEGNLRIGMIAEVRLRINGQGRCLVVPPEAVRVDATSTPYVFVVSQNHQLQQREVSVAGFAGEGTIVTGNLHEGELVVTSGTPMLAAGMDVRILEPLTAAE